MVRSRIADRYRDDLAYLFTPDGKDIINPRNREDIGRMAGTTE